MEQIKIIEELAFCGEINRCTVCNKDCKYFKRNMKRNGNIEIEYITAHASCRQLILEIYKLKAKLLNLEFKLFCLENS